MKNKNLVVSIVIIVVAVLAFIFVYRQHVTAPTVAPDSSSMTDATALPADASQSTDQDLKVSFQCNAGRSMAADFNLTGSQDVALALSDGRTMTLSHVASSTATQYASPDGSIILYSNGQGTFLQEGNVDTYSNCQLQNNAGDPGTAAQ